MIVNMRWFWDHNLPVPVAGCARRSSEPSR
jgi:hypothetical protein